MVTKKGKQAIVAISAGIIVVAAGFGVAALINSYNSSHTDPYKQTSSQQSSSTATSDSSSTSNNSSSSDTSSSTNSSTGSDSTSAASSTSSSPDPSTVSTIDITPLGITVSYVKGVGSFEYEVLRTQSGTSYVDFRNADLIGTKCTNDEGTFASIIKNPNSDEDSATITKKVTVDGVVYGLSLAASTCTSNADLLQKYQQSFSDAFSLLKKTS